MERSLSYPWERRVVQEVGQGNEVFVYRSIHPLLVQSKDEFLLSFQNLSKKLHSVTTEGSGEQWDPDERCLKVCLAFMPKNDVIRDQINRHGKL